MSVTAHLTEQFLLQKETKWFFNFRWLIIWCYIPDGWGLSKVVLLISNNPIYHRDIMFWWLHSFPITAILALPIWYIFGKRAAYSFWFSCWLHVIMDACDEIGVKLFYPFSNYKLSFGIWPWKDGNIITDLVIYYTTPSSLIIELFFLISAIIVLRSFWKWSIVTWFKVMWNKDSWSN